MSSSQTVLVTGGAGFIGTHLCRLLRSQGHLVRVLDLRTPVQAGIQPVEGVEYFQGDVRDEERVKGLLDGVDTVYHFAATVSVPVCQKDPVDSYDVNFTGTVKVLDAIRKSSSGRERPIGIVFASTAALYGNNGDDGRALREEDVAQTFASFYAAQKRASEQAIDLYRTTFGIPAVIFRFFNVFGPGQDPTSPYSGVISIFARLAREGRDLPLNGGGTQTRDFISVHDLVGACGRALTLPISKWDARPMNLGTGIRTTIQELSNAIIRVSGSTSRSVPAPHRDGDVIHSLADISRAREIVGLSPQVSLDSGLKELLL